MISTSHYENCAKDIHLEGKEYVTPVMYCDKARWHLQLKLINQQFQKGVFLREI